MRRLHPTIYLIGGLLAVLLAGVAITKLTVWNLVPLDAMQKRCFGLGVTQSFDTPLERAALFLGKSRVVSTNVNSIEVESFTIFHIPLGVLRGQTNVKVDVFCDQIANQQAQNSSDLFLPEPISLPSGWYAHRTSDISVLITQQKKLPDIGATEGYAYGNQVSISLAVNELEAHAWAEQQQWLNDNALVKSMTWSPAYGHTLLRVIHETEAQEEALYFLFVDNRLYTISMYPYPSDDERSGIVNALVDTYAK